MFFSDLGYVIAATMFNAVFLGNSTKFSLTLVIPKDNLTRYLLLHSVVEDRMTHIVSKLKAIFNKDPANAMEIISPFLEHFVYNIDRLYHCYLPPVKFSQTLFIKTTAFDFDFLARMITSQLQTHGSTVIIGDDPKTINMLVDSLSLFLTNPTEKRRSSHVVEGQGYVPDLVLQGIVTNTILDEGVIQSMLPTTLIDLSTLSVKQTHPYHEYSVLRGEFMRLEIDKLLTLKTKENLWTTQDGLFRTVKTCAPCVENMLIEALRLPASVREGYIVQSMRMLVRKAVVLIKYVEAGLEKAMSPYLEASIVKKIRVDLDISSEADFTVLLGIAEKLSPGMYVALAGDPASIEAKFVELFESF